MGRGRAKAKQQKVARRLKYNAAGHTDLDRLRSELGVAEEDGSSSADPYAPAEDVYADPYDELIDRYADFADAPPRGEETTTETAEESDTSDGSR